MPRQRARRVEHLHQPLEWQLLVAVGREIGRAHPFDQLAKLGLPEVSVRSTSVLTKKPISSSSAPSVRPAIGLPIGMSWPAPSRVSSAASRSLQHHEQAGAARARQPQQPAVQLGRQHERHAVAAIARYRRPRPVARQVELLGQVRERLGPERQLARDRALRIALGPQHLVLPQRVVGILHRQRRQIGRLSSAARRVSARQVARQRRQRPAVAGDVMQQQQQHVLMRAQHEQMRAYWQLARQVEAPLGRGGKGVRESRPR